MHFKSKGEKGDAVLVVHFMIGRVSIAVYTIYISTKAKHFSYKVSGVHLAKGLDSCFTVISAVSKLFFKSFVWHILFLETVFVFEVGVCMCVHCVCC